MKKTFLFFTFFLICQTAQADIILLKNGETVEGKVTQVRGIFIRVQPDYGRPFREFLIENVAHIEQTNPDEVSHLAIRNIHQRAINKARDQSFQDAANKTAAALIERAIQNSENLPLNGISDKVKAVAEERASALIGEAVKRVEPPELIDSSTEIKSIAQEKASGVIEQAVKDVEVLPLQEAPEGVQTAAKKAATVLIKGAVIDAETQTQRQLGSRGNSIVTWPVTINFSNWESLFSGLKLTVKDVIIGGLLILVLFLFFRENVKDSGSGLETKKDGAFASTLKELDKELEEFDKELTQKKPSQQEAAWREKRKYTRVKREFPISLVLDKVKSISAVVKNVSLGGAYAICDDIELLKLGDRCQFNSSFVDKNLKFGINGKAEVVRIRSNRGLGLKFSDLDENSLNYLLKF